MLKGRQEAAHVKSYGKGELAKDLCKGPESKESLEFSTNWKKPSKAESEREEIDEARGMWPYKGWRLDLILNVMENHWKV